MTKSSAIFKVGINLIFTIKTVYVSVCSLIIQEGIDNFIPDFTYLCLEIWRRKNVFGSSPG